MSDGYNGWKNYETWNVALWIGNDEGLYSLAREVSDYAAFKDAIAELSEGGGIALQTPDGVAGNDSGLDVDALDDMMAEL